MPSAIRAGISVLDFWELTYKEICVQINAVNDEKLDEMRYHAKLAHILGALVGMATWSKEPYPSEAEAFPGLFDTEEIERQRQELAMRAEKDKWLAYAAAFNQQRREGKA